MKIESNGYEEMISHGGHRLTPQRREVYDVLLADRDHPTATDVFLRAKQRMPSISLATVYNCLETLVECGLAKAVNVEREATRFCPNLEQHGHFVCEDCGRVIDIPFAPNRLAKAWMLPDGLSVTHCEMTLRGRCTACSSSKTKNPKPKITRQ